MDENVIISESVRSEEEANMEEELCLTETEEIPEKPAKKKSAVKIIAVCLAVVLALCAVGATLFFVYKHKTSEVRCTIFRNGLVPVQVDDKWGFINKKGELVIQPQYDKVKSFCNGLAAVRKDDKCGYINTEGKVVIGFQFEEAGDFAKNGLAAVVAEGKVGYINKDGEYEINPQFDPVADYLVWQNYYKFSNVGLAVVLIDEKYGVINEKGEYITNFEHDEVANYEDNGTARVRIGDKCGLIDEEGNYIVYPEYDSVGYFDNGKYMPVKKGDKWGYIDKRGKLVIQLQFDDAECFSNGLAAVKIGEKWGFINEKGKLVIKPQYKNSPYYGATKFSDSGYVVVIKEDESLAVIDTEGNYIIDNPEYDDIRIANELAVVTTENGEMGIINMKGEVVVEFGEYHIWSFVSPYFAEVQKVYMGHRHDNYATGSSYGIFEDGFIVDKNGKIGVLDKNGKVLIEPTKDYDWIRYAGGKTPWSGN